MIKITEEEWEQAIINMRKSAMEISAHGGGAAGCYSVCHEEKKIMHHQFEYEEYFEIDEDYIIFTTQPILQIVKLKSLEDNAFLGWVKDEIYTAYKQIDRDGVYVYAMTDSCTYTVEPDEEGMSYKNWFTLVGE